MNYFYKAIDYRDISQIIHKICEILHKTEDNIYNKYGTNKIVGFINNIKYYDRATHSDIFSILNEKRSWFLIYMINNLIKYKNKYIEDSNITRCAIFKEILNIISDEKRNRGDLHDLIRLIVKYLCVFNKYCRIGSLAEYSYKINKKYTLCKFDNSYNSDIIYILNKYWKKYKDPKNIRSYCRLIMDKPNDTPNIKNFCDIVFNKMILRIINMRYNKAKTIKYALINKFKEYIDGYFKDDDNIKKAFSSQDKHSFLYTYNEHLKLSNVNSIEELIDGFINIDPYTDDMDQLDHLRRYTYLLNILFIEVEYISVVPKEYLEDKCYANPINIRKILDVYKYNKMMWMLHKPKLCKWIHRIYNKYNGDLKEIFIDMIFKKYKINVCTDDTNTCKYCQCNSSLSEYCSFDCLYLSIHYI